VKISPATNQTDTALKPSLPLMRCFQLEEIMPTYTFRTTDQTGGPPVEMRYDFPDDEAAKVEAKTALTEMSQDGLPFNDEKRIVITVLDERDNCVVEFRLILEEFSSSGR